MSRDKNADNDWIIINFQRETNIRKGLIRNQKDLITNYINAFIYNNAVSCENLVDQNEALSLCKCKMTQ